MLERVILLKNTAKIVEELEHCTDFTAFYDENKKYLSTTPLSQLITELIKKHNLKKSNIIRNSEISEIYAYQIFSGKRLPERKKLLALCVGMSLNLDEVQSLLKCAGYSTLYVKLPFDSIIIYGICKKLTVLEINSLLFEYDLETLV